MTFHIDRFDLAAFVNATLAEDLGEGGDITSAAVIPAEAKFEGVMASRDRIVVAGLPIAAAFVRAPDKVRRRHDETATQTRARARARPGRAGAPRPARR